MRCWIRAALAGSILWVGLWPCSVLAEPLGPPTAIIANPSDAFAERLAAKEIRRYFYLRTGQLLPIRESLGKIDGGLIVVGRKDRPAVQALLSDGGPKASVDGLAAEQYLLKTFQREGWPVVLVAGGDAVGTLYGAYRLAEHWGVRFYLHGDELPDRHMAATLLAVDELGKPLFDRRGIQPFHDFPEGPDWWNEDGYKAVLSQLAKLRMNFFGLHTYPESGVGPEPLTWIGLPADVLPDGRVAFSYPARHFTTLNGTWGYAPMKTGDYCYGAAAMFERDDYGTDYMRGMAPWPSTPEDSNELFRRVGELLRGAFTFAGRLGIKTCLGTETPLTIPTPVRARLKAAGKDPADPAVVQEVYEGIFRRIVQTHPLDYYWFWTPEGWTWSAVSQEQIQATLADFRAAIAAAEKVKAPFTLATCGWVLGPPQQPALFDTVLPKSMPMSCINRMVGHAPVEPGFAAVKGRPTWAIPWMEDDPALNSPQLWVGRMRKDAADALAYGCTGLMGIHWRTRVLGPNVAALAAAAWDQRDWNPAINPQVAQARPKAPEGPDGGSHAAFTSPIADTDDDPVYQTVRYDVSAYQLDVPNGTYKVTLKFCEPHYKEPGKRVFGVKVQGNKVMDRLDLFAKVGQNRALDHVLENVQVTDGRLMIEFVYEVEYPSIAGIVVEGPVVRKINCGGPAWQDYQADWPPATGLGKRRGRFLGCEDFYADWARVQFGEEAGAPAAAIFASIDGQLPRPSDWVHGPGGIKPDTRPWAQVAQEYAFVDALAQLDAKVQGAGHRERFAYWLAMFRYLRANGQVNCAWARFNEALAKVKAEKDPAVQKRLARELALPVRKELVALVAQLHKYLLATVSTPGEMGSVTNWQQHNLPHLLIEPGKELARLLGEDLPAEAMPSTECPAEPRLVVPFVRTCLAAGEPLRLTAIVLGGTPREAVVGWRPLGTGEFAKVTLEHVARGVYCAVLPPQATRADLEYYVEVATEQGPTLRFPASAPALNQSVVVAEGQ